MRMCAMSWRTGGTVVLLGTLACRPATLVEGKGSPSAEDPAATDPTGVPDDPDADPTDVVYALDQFSHYALELDPVDWETLRHETRDVFDILVGDCQAEPFGSPFTWFPAELTIDGEYIGTIDVRKKGFLGSLSEDKPSLKLDLVEFDSSLDHHGMERLTLNNAVSDPALVRQCMGYRAFADAGIPASRCNFARVSVNGADLGVYVNVEPVKEAFLGRHFADATGDLYEGTLADFREGWTGTLERKTNEDSDDWSSVDGVVSALEGEDDVLIERLEAEVDLEQWFTYWATEVVVTHLDGYAGNTNNYFVYDDPERDRLVFLPWGIDAILLPQSWREDGKESVYANGLLASRLYDHPEGRSRYLAALDDVLDTVWNEDRLHERIDDMEAVVLPELGRDAGVVSGQVDVVRSVIDRRRDEIEGERADGPVAWDEPLRDTFCLTEEGSVTGSFATTWGSLSSDDPFSDGEADFRLDYGDETLASGVAGAVAGIERESAEHLVYMASWISDHEAILIYLVALPSVLQPGELVVDFDTATAAVFYLDTDTMSDFELASYIVGTFTFSELGTNLGDPVVGTLAGDLISL